MKIKKPFGVNIISICCLLRIRFVLGTILSYDRMGSHINYIFRTHEILSYGTRRFHEDTLKSKNSRSLLN